MLQHYIVIGILTLTALSCSASTESKSQYAFLCGSKTGQKCIINQMVFDSPNAFVLQDAKGKTALHIKSGSISALTMTHCDSLSSFQNIVIGRTSLRELCIAKQFRSVSAEGNNIQKLHTANGTAGEEFSIEVLNLNDNKLSSAESMRDFVALKELKLERNYLITLEMGVFGRMTNLRDLRLGSNRLIQITGAVELPNLSFLGLANNTLTRLDVQHWDMASLGTLQLASNNLTQVQGLGRLASMDKVTLAENNWECLALENMLEDLEKNSVTIEDADQSCDGIRNSSICCKVEFIPSEKTLLDELEKYTVLEERYGNATKYMEELIAQHKAAIDQAFNEVNQMMKAKNVTASGSSTDSKKKEQEVCGNVDQNKTPTTSPPSLLKQQDNITDPITTTAAASLNEDYDESLPNNAGCESQTAAAQSTPCESSVENCICPKKEVDIIKDKLLHMLAKLETNNHNVTMALEKLHEMQRKAQLMQHEFRTEVNRGELKLKQVNAKMTMLRNHIANKLNVEA